MVTADSLQLAAGGVTATPQAFIAEINAAGTDAVVVGPWPTQSGGPASAGFGVDARGIGFEQLGLVADPSSGIPANGSDFFAGGLTPGFDSAYGNSAVPEFHFAIFSFD